MRPEEDITKMAKKHIQLGDDGTLDTVIVCTQCNSEFRFNFASTEEADEEEEYSYDDFIDECIAEVQSDHVGLFGRCLKEEDN
jgi:hypothetical protein